MTRLIALTPEIWVRSSEHWQANAALVAADPETLVVIDPGVMPDEVTELRALAAEMAPHAHITAVFTHSDYDHVIGWRELQPQAVIAHKLACERDPASAREEVAAFDARFRIVRETPWDYPPRSLLFAPESLVPPRRYGISGLWFTFRAAPGHTADSQFVIIPERRLMLAGDYLSSLFFPMIFHSATDYLDSLELARQLAREFELERLIPGHGLPATSAMEVGRRISDDLAYVEVLIDCARNAAARGMTLDDALTDAFHLKYRGEPVNPDFAGNHQRNFELTYEEARQKS